MELLEIIKSIEPEIIFEELSDSNFIKSYEYGKLKTLETDAIEHYLENYNVNHIPVDTYECPMSHEDEVDSMFEKVFLNNAIEESQNLRDLKIDIRLMVFLEGFSFLNSDQNDIQFERMDSLITKVLHILNDKNLFYINKLRKEIVQKREDTIIGNIYAYSQDNTFEKAILFIGSAHRKSIIEKIEQRKLSKNINLNWVFWNANN